MEGWFSPADDPSANVRALMEVHWLQMPSMYPTHLHAEMVRVWCEYNTHCDARWEEAVYCMLNKDLVVLLSA